ncbi:MAG TPA: membrane dipeptidase [Polyangiaceae bacterium]|nr:membrane dipeptidase [Polyangiaceae bacterium]
MPLPPPVVVPDEGDFAVIDLHVDTPWQIHFKDKPRDLSEGHATLERLREGHYAGIVYPIYIPDYLHDSHPTIADADAILATVQQLIANHELLHAVSEGPAPRGSVGVFVAIEGAGAFAEDITQIDRFIASGVRLVGPVHARDNALATSATGKGSGGLSDLGKRFCERVYRAGALVDVSHMSDASFADLVPIARAAHAPIVATHSNARAVADNPRNLTDEQLRIIGETNGVAGLNLHRNFVAQGRARMKEVVAQVKHMVEVAGIDHVAIGSDFDGGTPVGAIEHAGKFPALAAALREAGFSDPDIRKIFAKNALRILRWRP